MDSDDKSSKLHTTENSIIIGAALLVRVMVFAILFSMLLAMVAFGFALVISALIYVL